MTAHLFTTWFAEYFQPTVETCCSEKKYSFQIILLTDNAPAHPGALMERDSEMNVVFVAADTTSVLQPTDQSGIPTFKSYYLRNTYHNAKTVYHRQ